MRSRCQVSEPNCSASSEATHNTLEVICKRPAYSRGRRKACGDPPAAGLQILTLLSTFATFYRGGEKLICLLALELATLPARPPSLLELQREPCVMACDVAIGDATGVERLQGSPIVNRRKRSRPAFPGFAAPVPPRNHRPCILCWGVRPQTHRCKTWRLVLRKTHTMKCKHRQGAASK